MREKFAQAVARGLNGKMSAIEAGYEPKSAHVRAHELKKRPDVTLRIAELREEANRLVVKNISYSKQQLAQDLLGIMQDARGAKDRSNAIRAAELYAKLNGMLVNLNADVSDTQKALAALSASELQGLIQGLGRMAQTTPSVAEMLGEAMHQTQTDGLAGPNVVPIRQAQSGGAS